MTSITTNYNTKSSTILASELIYLVRLALPSDDDRLFRNRQLRTDNLDIPIPAKRASHIALV